MEHHYDPALVVLSIAVSFFASFTALSLADRVGEAGLHRWGWLIGAAVAMGGGIWAMHFIAMLAFDPGFPVTYAVWPTVGSMVLAIGFTGIGLAVAAPRGRVVGVVIGGVFMGLGISAMHYTGMAAVRMAATMTFEQRLVLLSVAIAIVASIAALWLFFNLRSVGTKVAAAMAMATAVCGMHYTAMLAADFSATSGHTLPPAMPPAMLAGVIGAASFVLLLLALVSATVDRRVGSRLRQVNDNLETIVDERTRELRLAKEAAERASATKTQFLASMSHELRTPLNAIIGFSQMLEHQYFGPLNDKQTEYVRDIHRSGNHLLMLIDDVLDVAKLAAGKAGLQLEVVDPAVICRDAIADARALAPANGNEVRLELPSELPTIRTDRRRLTQCLLNLLGNACKFTKNGQITLRVQRRRTLNGDGTWLAFAIEDTGIGIAADGRRSLFKMFRQADPTIARTYGGTGVGLALTAELCAVLGGHIEFDSEVGRGSTFTVLLPVHSADKRAAADRPEPAPKPVHGTTSGFGPVPELQVL